MTNQPKIIVGTNEEVANTARAMARVTRSIFEGAPGTAGKISRKTKTANVSLKIGSKERDEVQDVVQRQIYEKLQQNAPRIEEAIDRAIRSLINSIIGVGNQRVVVFGETLTMSSPRTSLETLINTIIGSKELIGELGLPDPQETMRNLRIALTASITSRTVLYSDGPRSKVTFDQGRLLRLTPHPANFEGGNAAPFFSWLSLITGPDMPTKTDGFALVRVKDILNTLKSIKAGDMNTTGFTSIRRKANQLQNVASSSRSARSAGLAAGIMLSTIPGTRGRGISPAEAIGGRGYEDYSPSKKFAGFWDDWWTEAGGIIRDGVSEILGIAMSKALRME